MIINLGLPKSGTTTLAKALAASGLTVADFKLPDPHDADQTRFVGDLIYEGYFNHLDPLHFVHSYDALTEINALRRGHVLWPQMDFGLLATIEELYPDTKFIATTREAAAICDSMNRWTNLQARLPKFNIPGLPAPWGSEDRHKLLWIMGHYTALERYFNGRKSFLLLDVAAPDAKAQLEQFVERPISWWGVANANPSESDPK